ncbi:MAG TPA: decarboxylase [Alteromonas sp.]|jgi:DeoR/GlpR family transcriptional regulator of sugar metabolism|nr:decarboxylase [Alteromonas sp.]|tara:strand:+ start:3347 stop:4120 length:774 start_codon:yes stop_codon:yes gene_type:complete
MLDYAAFPKQRQLLLTERLQINGKLVCSELAEEFGVSEHTIRRDIIELSKLGICKKVYGGAIVVSPAQGSIAERASKIEHEKRLIAQAAIKLISPGSTIFLDSGTTNLAIVHSLPSEINITLITNSIPIANEALRLPNIELILLGGKVTKSVGGALNADAQSELSKMFIDMCFIGICAFSPEHGITGFNYDDACFKRALVKQSGQLIAAVSHEKYETIAKHKVVGLEGVSDLILCKEKLSHKQLGELNIPGLAVHLV